MDRQQLRQKIKQLLEERVEIIREGIPHQETLDEISGLLNDNYKEIEHCIYVDKLQDLLNLEMFDREWYAIEDKIKEIKGSAANFTYKIFPPYRSMFLESTLQDNLKILEHYNDSAS